MPVTVEARSSQCGCYPARLPRLFVVEIWWKEKQNILICNMKCNVKYGHAWVELSCFSCVWIFVNSSIWCVTWFVYWSGKSYSCFMFDTKVVSGIVFSSLTAIHRQWTSVGTVTALVWWPSTARHGRGGGVLITCRSHRLWWCLSSGRRDGYTACISNAWVPSSNAVNLMFSRL